MTETKRTHLVVITCNDFPGDLVYVRIFSHRATKFVWCHTERLPLGANLFDSAFPDRNCDAHQLLSSHFAAIRSVQKRQKIYILKKGMQIITM